MSSRAMPNMRTDETETGHRAAAADDLHDSDWELVAVPADAADQSWVVLTASSEPSEVLEDKDKDKDQGKADLEDKGQGKADLEGKGQGKGKGRKVVPQADWRCEACDADLTGRFYSAKKFKYPGYFGGGLGGKDVIHFLCEECTHRS